MNGVGVSSQLYLVLGGVNTSKVTVPHVTVLLKYEEKFRPMFGGFFTNVDYVFPIGAYMPFFRLFYYPMADGGVFECFLESFHRNSQDAFGYFGFGGFDNSVVNNFGCGGGCLLYTSPSPRDQRGSRMPSSA